MSDPPDPSAIDPSTIDGERARRAALDALHARHYLDLVRLAAHFVDDRATAEDLVQDVFAALARPGRSLDFDDERGYLHTAVVNAARSTLRRRVRFRRLVAPAARVAPGADASSLLAADRDALVAAIRRLPTRQREVVVLRFYEDLGIGEIAELLGIAPGAVSSSLNRAVNSLRPIISGADHD